MSTSLTSARRRGPSMRLRILGGLLIALAVGARLVLDERGHEAHTHAGTPAAQASTPDLIARLGGEEHAAAAARDALIQRLGAGALPLFRDLLDHPRPSTRALAVEAVTELAGKRRHGQDTTDTPPTAELLPALRERMMDYDALVRLRVVEGSARLGREAALPLLLAALRDEDEWIREAAARQLGELKARQSVEALIAGLEDPHPNVAGLCAAALRRITGEPIRYSYIAPETEQRKAIEAWKRWWEEHRTSWPRTPPAAPIPITRSAPAPPLEARDVTGRRIRLSELRGRIVLVNFFGSWCFPCVEELPGIASLQRRYAARGLQVIGLGVAEKSEADLRRFARRHRLPFPVAIAPEQVLEAWGDIHEVPVSFLIDRQGRIRRQWEGDRTERTFEAALTRLLEE